MPSSSASSGTLATGFDEKGGEDQGRASPWHAGGAASRTRDWGTAGRHGREAAPRGGGGEVGDRSITERGWSECGLVGGVPSPRSVRQFAKKHLNAKRRILSGPAQQLNIVDSCLFDYVFFY
jgi:hypothetical protein